MAYMKTKYPRRKGTKDGIGEAVKAAAKAGITAASAVKSATTPKFKKESRPLKRK